jgi:predicted peptidase
MKRMCVLLALALPARAQFAVEEALAPCVYTNAQGEAFPYRLRAPQFPEPGRKYPLILFLHGSGECGSDNRKQLSVGLPALMGSLLKRPEPVLVVAPQCQSGNWWVRRLAMKPDYAASKEPAASLEVALEICRHLVAERQADPERLYITGLSLGGFGTWDAIQREPALFAAAIPICGGGDVTLAPKIKALPIWAFHGDKDSAVPVSRSRDMFKALQACGANAQYREYPNAGHDVWTRTYADTAVLKWLFSQRKAQPKR